MAADDAKGPENPEDWKSFEDFSYGADTNRLPQSKALEGRTLKLASATAVPLSLTFKPGAVDWSVGGGPAETGWCEVVEVAPDTYFVDLVLNPSGRESLTLILNTATRRVLSVHCTIRPDHVPGEPQVTQAFHVGTIEGGEPSGEVPGPTRDLVGLRTHHVYSPNHTYEQTYLSTERYCWQCLVGVQRGHADVDLATMYRFAPGQYVFCFREFKVAVASVFFVNDEDRRSTGKFLGLKADGSISNDPAGSFFTKVSQTFYPAGAEPV